MSTLAHVFEGAGLSTIVLASMLDVVQRMRPPRALHCEFPLGRPLGKPGDPAFQRDVLERGLALLGAEEPVIETYPEIIPSDETPMACALPPRYDPDLPPAVDEAMGLRAAYDRAVRSGRVSAVGRAIGPDQVPDALAVLHRWAKGESWKEVALPGKITVSVCHDIRAYYEEAGIELVDGPAPGGRAAEAWFYEQTAAGRTVLAARKALKDQEAPFPFWFYMAPGHR